MSACQSPHADADGDHLRPGLGGQERRVLALDQHEPAVLRKQGDEAAKDVADLVQRLVVRVVVHLEVHHRGDLGTQVQQAAVALVGLGHQPLALPRAGVRAHVVELAADHVGRVEAAAVQDVRHHGGGRRLAVGAGDRDAAPQRHEAGEHLRPAQDGDAPLLGGTELGVVARHRRRDDDHGRLVEVLLAVTDRHRNARGGEHARVAVLLQVRALDADAHLVQDEGDAAHAGAADPDEVHRLREVRLVVRAAHRAPV